MSLKDTTTRRYSNPSDMFADHRSVYFWALQFLGWGGLCVVTFLSLTVWYGTPTWSHVSHTVVQALIGALLVYFMRFVFRANWDKSLFRQFFIIFICVTIISALWTVLRMQAFLWIAQEYDIWKDFGGWYFGSFMVILSWSAFYYGIKYYQLFQDERAQLLEEKLLRVSAESGAREAQMLMLRYQVNPHFLFNTFNSMSALIKTNRLDQARDMLSKLSHYMRYTLEKDQQLTTSLKEELELLKIYLDIERVRYTDRLQTEFNIAPETLEAMIPSMVLQPLFENTMKYVIAGTVSASHIRLSSHRDADKMSIIMEDTGHPDKNIDDVLSHLEKGVGLENTEARLRAHYKGAASLKLGVSDLGGLKIHIKVPFQTESRLAGAL